jgi:hypothetical protein
MYLAGPPDPGGPGTGPPCLHAAWRREFAGASPAAADPHLRRYLSDMAGQYGLPLRQELFDSPAGQSYGEMAAELLTGTLPPEPVDLLVLAFAMHDVIPGRSTAAYLSELCPGNPLAFAVCDAGSATPFTALAVIAGYAGTGGCERAVLVTLEQATLHYEPAAPVSMPAGNFAVALAFWPSASAGESAPRLDTVRQRPQVAPADVPRLLASELGGLAAGRPAVTVIAGSGLASLAAEAGADMLAGLPGDCDARLVTAPRGQPLTGVWWELAGWLDEGSAERPVAVLADYEPALGYLCTAAIEPTAGAQAGQLRPAMRLAG